MTCIVGLAEGGRVWLGGDSAGVSGSQLTIRQDAKVFRMQDMVLGCTTSFRMTQLLRYAFVPPEYTPDSDVYAYLVTTFVDAVRACFKQGGAFLIGFHGRLFCIEQDYQVGEPADGYVYGVLTSSVSRGSDIVDKGEPLN